MGYGFIKKNKKSINLRKSTKKTLVNYEKRVSTVLFRTRLAYDFIQGVGLSNTEYIFINGVQFFNCNKKTNILDLISFHPFFIKFRYFSEVRKYFFSKKWFTKFLIQKIFYTTKFIANLIYEPQPKKNFEVFIHNNEFKFKERSIDFNKKYKFFSFLKIIPLSLVRHARVLILKSDKKKKTPIKHIYFNFDLYKNNKYKTRKLSLKEKLTKDSNVRVRLDIMRNVYKKDKLIFPKFNDIIFSTKHRNFLNKKKILLGKYILEHNIYKSNV